MGKLLPGPILIECHGPRAERRRLSDEALNHDLFHVGVLLSGACLERCVTCGYGRGREREKEILFSLRQPHGELSEADEASVKARRSQHARRKSKVARSKSEKIKRTLGEERKRVAEVKREKERSSMHASQSQNCRTPEADACILAS